MKKLLITFFISLIIVIQYSSCKKIVEAIFSGLDVNIPTFQVTIPTIIGISPNEIALNTVSHQFNLDSIIKANTGGAFSIKNVKAVKIKEVTITLTNADQLNNLSNFESTRLTIQSNSNGTPTELFAINFPDTFASSVTINPTNTPDILSYLNGSTITYTIYGKNRKVTTKPLNMAVSVKVRVS
jgi:hypothetical protein